MFVSLRQKRRQEGLNRKQTRVHASLRPVSSQACFSGLVFVTGSDSTERTKNSTTNHIPRKKKKYISIFPLVTVVEKLILEVEPKMTIN